MTLLGILQTKQHQSWSVSSMPCDDASSIFFFFFLLLFSSFSSSFSCFPPPLLSGLLCGRWPKDFNKMRVCRRVPATSNHTRVWQLDVWVAPSALPCHSKHHPSLLQVVSRQVLGLGMESSQPSSPLTVSPS